MRPARSRMRITAYEVTDLPEPDSPTMPTVSPLATRTSTCSTARTTPRRVENSTVRSATSSSGTVSVTTPNSGSPLRIDDGAHPIAEQIEAEHRDHQRSAGKERDPPLARNHEGGAFRHHDSPFRRRRERAPPGARAGGGGRGGGDQ